MSSKSAIEQLLPFTGYYALSWGSGSFLLIDTNLHYEKNHDGVSMYHTATVTIHGHTDPMLPGEEEWSAVFDFESQCTFENGNLTVTLEDSKIVDVFLYKDYCNGNSSALRGTIAGDKVTGVTPFSPIAMPMFEANYYPMDALGVVGTTPQLKIGPDHSLWYQDVQVEKYTYNYVMFVITLIKEKVTFEMGTMAGYGRVAGNSAHAGLLVSIPRVQSYLPAPTK